MLLQYYAHGCADSSLPQPLAAAKSYWIALRLSGPGLITDARQPR